MKELITILNFATISQEIAKDSHVFYCAPGITQETGKFLLNLANQGQKLFIVCDIDAQNDYRGLNEIQELKKLFENENVKMKNSKGINVSLITDFQNFNYFLFPVSKIFKSDPEGYNAVAFNSYLASCLFFHFFHDMAANSREAMERVLNASIKLEIFKLNKINDPLEVIDQSTSHAEPITEDLILQIQKQIKEFPPEKPDLLRRINFINTYIQVVDLKFEGANWQSKKVSVSEKLIPFKSVELKRKLEAKLKIFNSDDANESLEKFNEFKKEIEDLRKEYLFRSKLRSKSIIKLSEKEIFKEKYEKLKERIANFQDSLFKLVKDQINSSKEMIKQEYIDFYKSNPVQELKQYKISYDEVIKDEVEKLVGKIQYPSAKDIIGELKMTLSFLNFTYEDFEDNNFLNELADWHKLSPDEYFKLFEKQKGFGVI